MADDRRPGWGALLPRFNIPETFGTALSYEGQLHWFLENWDEVAEYANSLEQPTITVGKTEFPDTGNNLLPTITNSGTDINAVLDFSYPVIRTRFADPLEWDFDKSYDVLTVVSDGNGNSYTSRQAVPAHTPLTDPDYWVLTGVYDASLQAIRDDVAQVKADYARVYRTVAEMQSDTTLVSGMICRTLGFFTAGDGGAAWYLIANGATANGMDVLDLATNDFASMVVDSANITVVQFGASGDGSTDCTAKVTRAMEIGVGKEVIFPTGTYVMGSVPVICPRGNSIKITGAKGATISGGTLAMDARDEGMQIINSLKFINSDRAITFDAGHAACNILVENCWFDSNTTAIYSNAEFDEVTINKCYFNQNTGVALDLSSEAVNNCVHVSNCHFRGMSGTTFPAISITNGTSIDVSDCTVQSGTPYIGFLFNNCKSLSVRNSYFEVQGTQASGTYAVRMVNTSVATFKSNFTTGAFRNVVELDTCSRVSFEDWYHTVSGGYPNNYIYMSNSTNIRFNGNSNITASNRLTNGDLEIRGMPLYSYGQEINRFWHTFSNVARNASYDFDLSKLTSVSTKALLSVMCDNVNIGVLYLASFTSNGINLVKICEFTSQYNPSISTDGYVITVTNNYPATLTFHVTVNSIITTNDWLVP